MNPETLYFALNASIPVFLAFLVWKIAKKFPRFGVATAVFIALLLLMRAVLSHNPHWEYTIFPWQDYLYFRTWNYALFPVFLLAILKKIPKQNDQRALVALAMLLYFLNIFNISWILISSNIKFKDHINSQGICYQSSHYTCGAASSVTLLLLHKIQSSETEMARLCLTRKKGGIFFLGAMRGLKIKCRTTSFVPKIAPMDYEQILKLKKPGLLSIKLPSGIHHMVCLLKINKKKVILGDPMIGKVSVEKERFIEIYQDFFIYLDNR